ncbi:MAG TPA: FAD-dependent thymidylate synthase [Solirubrobacterales bacterium]|nr:FAD-dependent thymidylate synthase [Solirubrobacterales bacterium]
MAGAQPADQEDDADADRHQARRLGDGEDRLLRAGEVAEDQRRQQPEGDREQRRQQVGGAERDVPLSIGADGRRLRRRARPVIPADYDAPVRYPVEDFTAEERALLAPHFTNLDRPVFALVNLPETVKGALFARYSRYSGTVRRLYLEEFAADAPAGGRPFDEEEGARAAQLYERVFAGYGDDSIAQLGGAHVACEWVSNILTKALQRGRLAAYLEQSTRYIPYDKPMPEGSYRFYRDDQLGPEFAAAMDEVFAIYSRSLTEVEEWAAARWPRGDEEPEGAWRRSIRAKALDLLRGLLPAATLSHVGIYATGQAYEQLIMRLLASPLPEARDYGGMILAELKQVMPSFVSRVDRPDRGGEWIGYLERRREQTESWVARLGLDRRGEGDDAPSVELLHVDGSEEDLLASSLFESANAPETEILARIDVLDRSERAELLAALVGERANRRYRPGRGFEALRYRFEIVSDYGAFRDLQRHRMLTCQWQRLTPDLGAGIPEEVREAGVGGEFERALEISRAEYERLVETGLGEQAPYALSLAYRIRYTLDLNAREAMHLIELRSGREGHPTYRAVAQAMHERIAAVHPGVAAAMSHVDTSVEPRLERIMSEIRTHRKRVGAGHAE